MGWLDLWNKYRAIPSEPMLITSPVQSVDAPVVSSVPTAQVISAGLIDGGELTIASGLITVTSTKHAIDTEADAATDDLAGAYGGSEGRLLFIHPTADARTIVVKHDDVAEGVDGTRFWMTDDADVSLDDLDDGMLLMWRADLDTATGGWQEVARGTTAGDLAAHIAAGDPHTGYQKESEKGAASGYMGLDASGYGNSPPKGHDHTAAGDGGVLTNEAHDGYSEFAASADPAAPAGTIVRLYNSAGKIYARTATAFDGPIHAQYHEIVDDVHATTAWKMWYSAADGKINEITLGADGQVLTSAGPAAPPVFEDAAGGISQAQVLARVSLRG
jgi:hypothetical protein